MDSPDDTVRVTEVAPRDCPNTVDTLHVFGHPNRLGKVLDRHRVSTQSAMPPSGPIRLLPLRREKRDNSLVLVVRNDAELVQEQRIGSIDLVGGDKVLFG